VVPTSMMTSSNTLPILARLLRGYLRSDLPGRTKLATYAAQWVPSLQRVPIRIARDQIVFMDMRDAMSRDILRDSPYEDHPWEPDEQKVMRRIVRSGEIAFDIGAHLGEHSVLLSRLVGVSGQVFAFEPNPDHLGPLRRTVMQHGNGRVLPLAISDRPGTTVLYIPDFHVTASLADWTNNRVGAIRTTRCEQIPLDTLVGNGVVPQPDFIKCDVEGAELLVFRGAVRTLERTDAPIIMYEANLAGARAFGFSISASTEFLARLRAPAYSFFWVQPQGTLVPVRELRSDVGLFNLVAVPELKRDRVSL
jgi:FkbM family methyltransferase